MGKIEFANCQDVRNQKKIQELDCPRCHEPGVGIGLYLARTIMDLLDEYLEAFRDEEF